MSMVRTARFVCYAVLLFAAQFPAAAQDSFTDAEGDGIKGFLHDNFRQTNACMVIGLADQRGNRKQYETYTVEKMYAFLSGYTLSRDPGTEFEYSNVGMALLGHVIALKAGTNFESLVVNQRRTRPVRPGAPITLTSSA